MANVFFIDNTGGYDSDLLVTETEALNPNVMVYLVHDKELDQMFTLSQNVAIEVSNYNDYPNTQVRWYPISNFWLSFIQLFSFGRYYFILSNEQHTKIRDEAFLSNAYAFRLGKRTTTPILAYIVRGTYTDFMGGAGPGLLHGAMVPPP